MTIYVQKLSVPAEEWEIDAEASDTLEAVKSKLVLAELPNVYDPLKIHIFKDSLDLLDTSTLSDYNIQKFSHLTSSYDSTDCNPIFDKFAYGNEDGCQRYRRLWLLGYI